MRIAIIDKEEGLKVGGIVMYNKRLQQYLSSHNHSASILRFAKIKPKENYIYHIPYYMAEPRSFIFIPSERSLIILKKYLLKIKPDIVYISAGISPLDFLIPSVCHDLKIPIAGVWHADFNDSLSSMQVLVKSIFLAYIPFCRQLDMLHLFSDKLAKFHIRRGVKKERILILPNGIDQNFYKPGISEFGKHFNIKTGILFLGRLTLVKNPELLIRTFLKLDPPRSTKLILVGYGEQEETLREKYKDERIIFTGAVLDENKKLDIMRSCKIFVLPSKFEGMSLALLEAMSTGLACVVSDAGSNRELVAHAGIMIRETKLDQELSPILRILLEHAEITNLLGLKSREKVLKQYSQNYIFQNLTRALQETIIDYRKRGSPKTQPLNLDRIITDKLRDIWSEAKKLSDSI